MILSVKVLRNMSFNLCPFGLGASLKNEGSIIRVFPCVQMVVIHVSKDHIGDGHNAYGGVLVNDQRTAFVESFQQSDGVADVHISMDGEYRFFHDLIDVNTIW